MHHLDFRSPSQVCVSSNLLNGPYTLHILHFYLLWIIFHAFAFTLISIQPYPRDPGLVIFELPALRLIRFELNMVKVI